MKDQKAIRDELGLLTDHALSQINVKMLTEMLNTVKKLNAQQIETVTFEQAKSVAGEVENDFVMMADYIANCINDEEMESLMNQIRDEAKNFLARYNSVPANTKFNFNLGTLATPTTATTSIYQLN